MNWLRSTTALLAVSACVVFPGVWLAGGAGSPGPERATRDNPAEGLWGRLGRLERERRELDRRLYLVHRIRDARRKVTEAVIAGRLTLVQAAARFYAADACLPTPMIRVRLDSMPGNSDGERECRAVLLHVKVALEGVPGRRDRVVPRLEAELQKHLRRLGSVRLPAPAWLRRR
jgi:hypothetical protein